MASSPRAHRLVIGNTVEDRIVALQERKVGRPTSDEVLRLMVAPSKILRMEVWVKGTGRSEVRRFGSDLATFNDNVAPRTYQFASLIHALQSIGFFVTRQQDVKKFDAAREQSQKDNRAGWTCKWTGYRRRRTPAIRKANLSNFGLVGELGRPSHVESSHLKLTRFLLSFDLEFLASIWVNRDSVTSP
ncbi:hypothetical protein PQX77_006652 [Marasmius sp. AFHP31]|nr:hypothetical protein PQX77_006652 [Marasmius sp. AFHP31]